MGKSFTPISWSPPDHHRCPLLQQVNEITRCTEYLGKKKVSAPNSFAQLNWNLNKKKRKNKQGSFIYWTVANLEPSQMEYYNTAQSHVYRNTRTGFGRVTDKIEYLLYILRMPRYIKLGRLRIERKKQDPGTYKRKYSIVRTVWYSWTYT